MTIAITSSGIALDGPLVAGEKVAVTVSGLALAAEDKPTLALLARFPDALLASVELAESADAPGTWTGELDTATKQTALFFATARADERRDAALELVAGRVSIARLTVPMANSALCPKPDGSPSASPVYVPVPGPPGQGGDPYDQAPQMDGEASAGTADEYARGDHRHPTDATRASASDVATIQNIIPSTATPSNKLATAADIPAAQVQSDWAETSTSSKAYIKNKPSALAPTAHASTHAANGTDPITPASIGAASSDEFAPVEQVVSQLPSPYEILTLDSYNNVRKNGTELTAPPSVYGHSLALQEGIAPAFSSSSTYAVGDYVTHEGLLYKCTSAVSAHGAWNAANWTAARAMEEMPAPGAAKNVWYGSTPSNQMGRNFTATTTSGDFVLSVGNVVIVRFDGALVTSNDMTLNVDGTGSKAIRFPADASVVPEGYWKNLAQIAFAYDGSRYRPISFVAQAGLYGYGLTKLTSTVDNTESLAATPKAVNTRAPLESPAFTGTPTAPTAAAGTSTTQIATTAFVQTEARYALTAKTPSVSGTSATVACEDLAINDFTVATGITSLTITPPAAVTGRARDFFCRVTLTDSSLPTVTLSGGTIDIGSTEVAGMTQGVNLLMLTEIASGHWLASRRSAS